MQSFYRLFFTGVVMLLFLGALEDRPVSGDSVEPLSTSPVHQPEAFILAPLNPVQWADPAPPVWTYRYLRAIHTDLNGQRHFTGIAFFRLKNAAQAYLDIKPDLTRQTGYHPRRIPDPAPADPPEYWYS